MSYTIPRVAGGRRHDHRAAGLAHGLDHAAKISQPGRDESQDRVYGGEDGVGTRIGDAVDEDVDALLACLPPGRIEPSLLVERRATRLVDGAGEDPAWVMGIGEERIDLEDALAQLRLEMVAHLVEHGMH